MWEYKAQIVKEVMVEDLKAKGERLYKFSCLASMIVTLVVFGIVINYGILEIVDNDHEKAILYATASAICYALLQRIMMISLQKIGKLFEDL